MTLGFCATGPAGAALLNQHGAAPAAAVLPSLSPPPGCVPDAPVPATDGHATLTFRCKNGQLLGVTVVTLPIHAPPDQLQRERARLAVPPRAEDTAISPIRSAPPGAGRWSLLESREPDLIAGVASWVGGAPASGGLAGRIRLAWDSLHGASHMPMLIAVIPVLGDRVTGMERQRARDLVERFIEAQPDLTSAVEAATRSPGG